MSQTSLFETEIIAVEPPDGDKGREERGAFYTPDPLALAICKTLNDLGIKPGSILEPGCGGGAFLRAAAARMERHDDEEESEGAARGCTEAAVRLHCLRVGGRRGIRSLPLRPLAGRAHARRLRRCAARRAFKGNPMSTPPTPPKEEVGLCPVCERPIGHMSDERHGVCPRRAQESFNGKDQSQCYPLGYDRLLRLLREGAQEKERLAKEVVEALSEADRYLAMRDAAESRAAALEAEVERMRAALVCIRDDGHAWDGKQARAALAPTAEEPRAATPETPTVPAKDAGGGAPPLPAEQLSPAPAPSPETAMREALAGLVEVLGWAAVHVETSTLLAAETLGQRMRVARAALSSAPGGGK